MFSEVNFGKKINKKSKQLLKSGNLTFFLILHQVSCCTSHILSVEKHNAGYKTTYELYVKS
jgi:hypothetical protein